MSAYVVSYDSNKSKDCEKQINTLKTVFDDWWHHLDSTVIGIRQAMRIQYNSRFNANLRRLFVLILVTGG
jgi:hypothetical protein